MTERKYDPEFAAFARQIIRSYYRAVKRWQPDQPNSEVVRRRVKRAVRRFWRTVEFKSGLRTDADHTKAKEQLDAFASAAQQLYNAQKALNDIALEALDDDFRAHDLMPDAYFETLANAAQTAATELLMPDSRVGAPSQPELTRMIALSVITDFEAITGRAVEPEKLPGKAETGTWGLRALVKSVFAAMGIEYDARSAYEAALLNRAK